MFDWRRQEHLGVLIAYFMHNVRVPHAIERTVPPDLVASRSVEQGPASST